MAGEDTNKSSPPPIAPPEAPQMVSSVKLHILKKGEYILWTIKIEQYLARIDYALWEVILNSNGKVQMTKDEAGNEVEVPLVTSQQILTRTRERKAKSTPLMAILDEHLARFHGIKDAKTLWADIKTKFGGNAESKKMQKNVLKQQFEYFFVSNSEGLDKGYDRFQRLLSLLEIHEACVSTEDANKFFLRSLPLSWSNISLIMRNKPGIDNLDIDDLYNNLKVYEADIKGSSRSSSNTQNVTFVFAESTSSTNELNAAYSVSTATGHSSQAHGSSSYADELMFSFFANQSSSLQLDNEDLEKINQDDLEEMDLKWQVAMLFMRVKRFYKKTRRKLEFNGKEPVGFDKTKVECFNCHRRGHFSRDCRTARNPGNMGRDAENTGYRGRDNGKRPARVEDEKELVVQDRLGTYDWSYQLEEEVTETVFDNRSSDEENSLANDRFKKGERFHTVPPPLTENYMLPKPDLSFAGLDDSFYKFKISETITSLSKEIEDAHETSTAFVEKSKEVRTIFTRSGRILVSAAKPKATTSTSAAKPVNTVGPKQSVNFSNSRSSFNKSYSPIRRNFYNATTHSRINLTEKVNTASYKSSDDKAEDDKPKDDTGSKTIVEPVNKEDQAYKDELDRLMSQEKEASDATDSFSKEFEQGCMDQRGVVIAGSTNNFNTVSNPVNAVNTSGTFSDGRPSSPHPDTFIPDDTLLHVYKNKKDERGIVVRNKARLVTQGHRQEEGIDYAEVFAPVARIEAIRIFLAFASFMGFIVYQMDVKSAFLNDTIEEEDKYVVEILRKFDFSSMRTTSTPIETQMPLVKDEEAANVDVHLYRSMIGSLMYLIASRPDIMFVVCACSRFQVTPKLSHLHDVRQIFRRLISWQCKMQTIIATSTTEAKYVAGANCYGQGEGSGSGPGCQETMGDAMAQIRPKGAPIQSRDPTLLTGNTVGSGEDRMEHAIELTDPVPQTPHDLPLLRGHTPGSNEGRMTLKELMDLCTTLSQKVLDLEKVKIA
nr:hypothetical protein [Tanacetum cinerariifolium]